MEHLIGCSGWLLVGSIYGVGVIGGTVIIGESAFLVGFIGLVAVILLLRPRRVLKR